MECIYEGEDQLYIKPDECIDCAACEPECPVTAIFEESAVPDEWKSYIAKNYEYFDRYPDAPVAREKKSRFRLFPRREETHTEAR
ncbi:MAG: ferredoxin family protein [candidate division NC10 bacterium]